MDPLCFWSGELTCIVEGLDPIQVLIYFVLDSLQFGPCHASIYQSLGCLLKQVVITEKHSINWQSVTVSNSHNVVIIIKC